MRQRLLRRRLLGWMVSGGTLSLLAACGGSDGTGSDTTTSTTTGSTSGAGSGTTTASGGACVEFPGETNGPFPADGTNSASGGVVNVLTQSGVVRSDITRSFGASTTAAAGVPLTLTIMLEDTGTACALLSGYAIYIWHCNRAGEYSLYSSDIVDENYLRGVQVTDSNGQVTFQSIYPACYSGRYPHIHVEVYASLTAATSGNNALLTTQLAMPRDACNTVYGGATGYSASVANLAQVTTANDNVFDSSSGVQLTAQTPVLTGDVSSGYSGRVTIGVA
jgi:protocatechuate 3,4-dioxygenase beta subunit